MPLHHPAVRRYVAVDEVCVDRLVREEGIDACRVELFLNFVDLDRFRQRAPLPARPARALVLGNAARQEGYVRAIATACQATAVALDVVGLSAGNSSSTAGNAAGRLRPRVREGPDRARSARRRLRDRAGRRRGAGPLVTPENYDTLRPRNFGIRALTQGHDAAWYGRQIAGYRPDATAALTARVRAEAGMDVAIDRLLDIYSAAIAAPPGPGDRSPAAAVHCRRIAVPLKQSYGVAQQLESMALQLSQAQATTPSSPTSWRPLEARSRSFNVTSPRSRRCQRFAFAMRCSRRRWLDGSFRRVPGVCPKCWGIRQARCGRANAACGVRPDVDFALLKRHGHRRRADRHDAADISRLAVIARRRQRAAAAAKAGQVVVDAAVRQSNGTRAIGLHGDVVGADHACPRP